MKKEEVFNDENKDKTRFIFENKSLIKVFISIVNTSCRQCKQRIPAMINNDVKVTPESFCAACRKKNEHNFEKIRKALEVEE